MKALWAQDLWKTWLALCSRTRNTFCWTNILLAFAHSTPAGLPTSIWRVTRVTRMAYSPSLWLMAIGWWNKTNQLSDQITVTAKYKTQHLYWSSHDLSLPTIGRDTVSKIETKSDTNLRSLYESWFRSALISKSVILWWQVKKGRNSELEGANTRRVLNIPSKGSLYLMRRPFWRNI